MDYSLSSILSGRPAVAFGAGEYFDRYCENPGGIFEYLIDDTLAGQNKKGVPIHPVSYLHEEKRDICLFLFQRSQALALLSLHALNFQWGKNLFDARWFGDIGSPFADFVVLDSMEEILHSPEIAIYRSPGSHLNLKRLVVQKLSHGAVPELHLADGCEFRAEELILSQNTKICCAQNGKISLGKRVSFSPETTVACGRNSILQIGASVQFSPRTVLNAAGYTSLKIGDGSSFGASLDMYVYAPLEIGKDCMFSSQIFVVSGAGHDLNIRGQLRPAEEIRIGNHVWVGWGCKLLSGAGIGDGGMVAAGSIVNKSFKDHRLVAGTPAKAIHEEISWQRDFSAYKTAYYPKA